MPLADVSIDLPERYRVVRHVANGGMASVWAAEDAVLGRLVAVKVLASHIAADPSARTRFEREARTAAKVSAHPNVVTIYDVGEHGGIPFIVMELYEGGSMAERLRGTIPRQQALDWLRDAAAALDYAHDEGIVHRDVKPANLLLDPRGRLGVADFGIARLVDDSSLTQAGQVLGTAAYLSPEQALGRAATAASDRYALAIVAFELLTGQRPFGGEHVAAQARQHVEADPPGSGLGGEADAVLHRAMAKDPDERYPTATRFVEELQAVTGKRPAPEATEKTRRLSPVAAAPAAAADAAPRTPTPTPAPSPRPDPANELWEPPAPQRAGGDRRGRALLIGLGLAALLAGLIAVLASAGGGGDDPERASTGSTPAAEKPAKKQKKQAEEQPQAAAPAPQAEADPAPDNEAEEGPGPSASGESPSSLNDQGYAKLQAGDAAGAVPVLQQAVAGFEQQGSGAPATTYGYALYNLAEALRQSGKPAEAIPYYERRLQVNPSDRPQIVQASLAKAKAAAGRGD